MSSGHLTSKTPTYLTCPFKDKDKVKALGARWDYHSKAWFVQPHKNLVPFEAWKPFSASPPPPSAKRLREQQEEPKIKVVDELPCCDTCDESASYELVLIKCSRCCEEKRVSKDGRKMLVCCLDGCSGSIAEFSETESRAKIGIDYLDECNGCGMPYIYDAIYRVFILQEKSLGDEDVCEAKVE